MAEIQQQRIGNNPNDDVCPDFASQPFEWTRGLLRGDGKSNEEVIKLLTDDWLAHKAVRCAEWNRAIDANPVETNPVEPTAGRNNGIKEVDSENSGDSGEKDKKKSKLLKNTADSATNITPRPSSYALNKLANYEYIELWYFTQEGCADALLRSVPTDADDTFGLSRSGDAVIIKPVAWVQASKRQIEGMSLSWEQLKYAIRVLESGMASKRAIEDASLTWEQFTYAARALPRYLLSANWPSEYIEALVEFFIALEDSYMLDRPMGRQIVLNYQAHARRSWMDAMKEGSRTTLFNIAKINDSLMKNIAEEYWHIRNFERLTRFEDSLRSTGNDSYAEYNPRRGRAQGRRSRSRSPQGRKNSRARNRQYSPFSNQRFGNNDRDSRHFQQGTRADSCPRSACAMCLGRHKHDVFRCTAPTLWDRSGPTRCIRNDRGRLINPQGQIICIDFQKPSGCASSSSSHIHECSACGRLSHGAQACSRAQKD